MGQIDQVNRLALKHSRKYHGKVGCARKLRLLVLVPKLNVAELEADNEDKEEEDSSAADEEPSKVEGDISTPTNEFFVRPYRVLWRWKETLTI
jgi:hypothetical protein